jgi:hypothetical protein
MLRRLLTIFVVLSVLGYGTTQAFDAHALDFADQTEIGSHDHSKAGLDEACCDHSCHASAHLVGLASSLPRFPAPRTESFRLDPDSLLATFFSALPLRPPRS